MPHVITESHARTSAFRTELSDGSTPEFLDPDWVSCSRDCETLHLLPRCYQDRTNQRHQAPCRQHPLLWFLVALGCLRLDLLKFVNRRSFLSSTVTCFAKRSFCGFVSPHMYVESPTIRRKSSVATRGLAGLFGRESANLQFTDV